MVVDFERAWVELQSLVAEKSQHGRDTLLREMARIAAECRVPPGQLSSLLRLYGVEVERARSMAAESDRDSDVSPGGGLGSPADAVRPGHHRPIGGHDGSRNGRTRAVGR